MNAIVLNNLVKTYNKGSVVAVDGLSLSIPKGELFGLIGPDGAGKTSIFRMLTTLLLPDGGSAQVDGFDIVTEYKKIRSRVGYMPGKFSLYQDLTIKENLDFFATVFGTTVAKNYDLIRDIYVQIEPFKNRRAGKLSGGMKQKLALCCALIHKPSILFLDEPTTGVDVVSRKEFWIMLQKLKEQKITIIVSTPYMDEAVLCDRIALMQQGKMLFVGSPEELIQSYPTDLYGLHAVSMHQLLVDMHAYEYTESCFAFGDFLHVTLSKEAIKNKNEHLVTYLKQKNHTDTSIEKITPTIEDCFIRLLKI